MKAGNSFKTSKRCRSLSPHLAPTHPTCLTESARGTDVRQGGPSFGDPSPVCAWSEQGRTLGRPSTELPSFTKSFAMSMKCPRCVPSCVGVGRVLAAVHCALASLALPCACGIRRTSPNVGRQAYLEAAKAFRMGTAHDRSVEILTSSVIPGMLEGGKHGQAAKVLGWGWVCGGRHPTTTTATATAPHRTHSPVPTPSHPLRRPRC